MLAPPSVGDVSCTRRPAVSFSSTAMLPGGISSFSSISSPVTTSTRSGSSSMRRSPRVETTTIASSSTAASASSIRITVSRPARISTVLVAGAKPIRVTRSSCAPGTNLSRTVPSTPVTAAEPPVSTAAPSTGRPS